MKEIKDRKKDNAILRKASGDREVTNISQIVSRAGPPESASKVTHQLRELFLGKIAEANYRTDEVQEVMTGLVTNINSLTAQLPPISSGAFMSGQFAATLSSIFGGPLPYRNLSLAAHSCPANPLWRAYVQSVRRRAFAYL